MMRIIVPILLLVVQSVWAKHTAVNITGKGLGNILGKVVSSYHETQGTRSLTYSSKPVFERISASSFNENKVIKAINNFVPLNQKEDFIFYIDTSPIKIDGNIIADSFRVATQGSQKSFDLGIKVSIEGLNIHGNSIELCELKKWKCDREKNLFGKVKNYSISSRERLDLAAILTVNVVNGKTSIKFKEMYSNLKSPKNSTERYVYEKLGISKNPIKLNINFSDFILPHLKLTIDGEELRTDLTKLKDAILAQKDSLGRSLALLAGEFITKDLVELVNKEVMIPADNITSKFSVLDYGRELEDIRNQVSQMFNSNARPINFASNLSMMDKIKSILKAVVSSAKYDLEFAGAKASGMKNLSLQFTNSFSLNGKKWNLSESLRNGKGRLADINFEKIKDKNYDFAVAISEPVLNGALDAINKTDIIQRIVKDAAEMKGIYVKNVHLHLEGGGVRTIKVRDRASLTTIARPTVAIDNTRVAPRRDYRLDTNLSSSINNYKPDYLKGFKEVKVESKGEIVLVAEVEIKLSELSTEGIGNYISNGIGSMVESGKIWFPLEISFVPKLVRRDGKMFISFKANNPIKNNTLKNTYGYPYKEMWSKVENSVISTLEEDLIPQLDSLPEVEITSFLDIDGLKLIPKNIYVEKSGHIIITTDIERLNLKTLGSK
jgi:hypothetical protein